MEAPVSTGIAITWLTKDGGPDALLDFGGAPRDITKDIAPHLLSLAYTDNLTGAVDDLSLELEDREGLWSGDWRPAFGDRVQARITADPWLTDVKSLLCGDFSHDKISLSGFPKRASIKAVSAPLASGLRRTKRTRAWSGVTLFQIASDIAARASVGLQWIGEDKGTTYRKREQKDKTDLEFLEEECREVGRALKVTQTPIGGNHQFSIVIFREEDQDATDPVGDLSLIGGHVLGWSFDSADAMRYGNAHLKFSDPHTGKLTSGEFPPVGTSRDARIAMGLDPDGQTIEVRLAAEDKGHAIDICKGRLRAANNFANTGSLTVKGDPGLVAGVTFNLTDAFGFDGKFIITKAEHRVAPGYTCTLDVRRTIGGY